ncbi:MAG: Gfo/Idh/MocA family oxidoreductase, partial [Syntrophomonadaceae bacterium]
VKAGGHSVNIIEEWIFADQIDDPDTIKAQFHENPPNIYGFGHKPLYADMIAAINNNRPPYIDAHAGKRAVELVLAIYKAAADRRPVQLPLNRCSTMDFVNRFNFGKKGKE